MVVEGVLVVGWVFGIWRWRVDEMVFLVSNVW